MYFTEFSIFSLVLNGKTSLFPYLCKLYTHTSCTCVCGGGVISTAFAPFTSFLAAVRSKMQSASLTTLAIINKWLTIKPFISCVARATFAWFCVTASPACLCVWAWLRARVVYIHQPMTWASCGRSHFNYQARSRPKLVAVAPRWVFGWSVFTTEYPRRPWILAV